MNQPQKTRIVRCIIHEIHKEIRINRPLISNGDIRNGFYENRVSHLPYIKEIFCPLEVNRRVSQLNATLIYAYKFQFGINIREFVIG